MKFAVCAIAKLENHYIREWVEYYLSIGFDKIILYDNNDFYGEDLSDPIKDYIDNKKVDLLDAREKVGYQVEAYNDCYQKYKDQVDWILFVDIDEFLAFESCKTISEFINTNSKFENYNVVLFNWLAYSDNNLLTVENNNYSVLSRFTEKSKNKHENFAVKQMVRTNISNLQINGVHHIAHISGIGFETTLKITNTEEVMSQIKFCDSWGDPTDGQPIERPQAAYLNHYRYKTLQEYLELKCKRGYPMPYKHYGRDLDIISFFSYNKITQEKIDYIITWLKTADISEEEKNKFIKSLDKCLEREYLHNKKRYTYQI